MHIAVVTLHCVNVRAGKDEDCRVLDVDCFTNHTSDFANDSQWSPVSRVNKMCLFKNFSLNVVDPTGRYSNK